MAYPNLRDFLYGDPHPSELSGVTLQSIAAEKRGGPRVHDAPENPEFTAKLPGDSLHPLAEIGRNPFPGVGVQEVNRRLRAGELTDAEAQQAVAYIDQFQKLTGQEVYKDQTRSRFEAEPLVATATTELEFLEGLWRTP